MTPSEQVRRDAPLTDAQVNERWSAVTLPERRRFMVYGSKPAKDESPPDYAERILKFDPRITLANARKLSVIFRAAYEGVVSGG